MQETFEDLQWLGVHSTSFPDSTRASLAQLPVVNFHTLHHETERLWHEGTLRDNKKDWCSQLS